MDIIKKVKTQLAERENMFANHTSDRSLISKIYKELLQKIPKQNQKTQFLNGQRT